MQHYNFLIFLHVKYVASSVALSVTALRVILRENKVSLLAIQKSKARLRRCPSKILAQATFLVSHKKNLRGCPSKRAASKKIEMRTKSALERLQRHN
eukprot:scaffold9614_cov91-Skeletonema_dohrnii-CCMP3373.AAC.7